MTHHITVASSVKEISGVQYPLAGSVASSQDKKWENPQSFSLWLNMCWILREIFSVINSGWWGITRRVAVPVHDQFWVSASALHFLQILKRNKIFFEKFKNSSETMKIFDPIYFYVDLIETSRVITFLAKFAFQKDF